MTTGLLAATASGLALWPGSFLVAGGLAKAPDVSRGRIPDSVATRLVPAWLPRRAAWALAAAAELAVGVLVLTGLLVPWPEAAAALLLGVAALVAVWGLRNAPDADCGCFGGAVSAPVTVRTAIRAGTLAAFAALAAVGGESWTSVFHHPVALLVVLAAGVALAWLTPELPEAYYALRATALTRAEPVALRMARRREAACERRDVPVDRSVARLRSSELWARARPYISADAPTEHWEEGCSRFICYPAVYDGEPVTAVFSVDLGFRQRAGAVAFVDEDDRRVLGRFEAKERRADGVGARP